ncbi:MAG: hypothetical protein HY650_02690 [Acidobacteria bacterium]|nr:hypothetical protein [Acidobacteriota bacterium]
MKAITLRGISTELAGYIRRLAVAKGLSVNKVVIGLLEERIRGTGRKERRRRYHDLDALAGSWSTREAAAFDRALAEQRGLDPEIWK